MEIWVNIHEQEDRNHNLVARTVAADKQQLTTVSTTFFQQNSESEAICF